MKYAILIILLTNLSFCLLAQVPEDDTVLEFLIYNVDSFALKNKIRKIETFYEVGKIKELIEIKAFNSNGKIKGISIDDSCHQNLLIDVIANNNKTFELLISKTQHRSSAKLKFCSNIEWPKYGSVLKGIYNFQTIRRLYKIGKDSITLKTLVDNKTDSETSFFNLFSDSSVYAQETAMPPVKSDSFSINDSLLVVFKSNNDNDHKTSITKSTFFRGIIFRTETRTYIRDSLLYSANSNWKYDKRNRLVLYERYINSNKEFIKIESKQIIYRNNKKTEIEDLNPADGNPDYLVEFDKDKIIRWVQYYYDALYTSHPATAINESISTYNKLGLLETETFFTDKKKKFKKYYKYEFFQ